jgi:hypothetical protein
LTDSFIPCSVVIAVAIGLGGPDMSASPAHPQRKVRILAYRVCDDDGTRPARVTPDQVAQWVEFANRTFASAGIRFEFGADDDFHSLRSTLLNDLSEGEHPDFARQKLHARQVAAQHPDRLVVLFRHGRGATGWGNGFAGPDLNFVVMPGWEDASHCGHSHVDALAHEIGHYLALRTPLPGLSTTTRRRRRPCASAATTAPPSKGTACPTHRPIRACGVPSANVPAR